jgi:D-alanyl-D-alanine carboxypeptidase (penicillin-binding protein 5/6)
MDIAVAKGERPVKVPPILTGLLPFLPKFAAATLVFALLGAGAPRSEAALASITVDATTGHVLARQDAQKKRQVGSLTKIATAMVVLDWAAKGSGDLAQVATVPPAAFLGTTENNLGLQPGDTLTLRDLLYAALVQSDNIAAYTLADYVGHSLTSTLGAGSTNERATDADVFVRQMNALAQHLGMLRTRFLNPSGLDAREKPFSCAEDIARLTIYAMHSAGFRFYVSQKEREIAIGRGPQRLRYLLRNTNQLLGTDAIDGVKTGSTARAGDCLVLSAARPSEVAQQGTTTLVTPRRLIVVLLASPDRFVEGQQQLARGWELYDQWAAAGRPTDPKETLVLPNER